jgi:crotonobetainyl-CoA:carnitine CoA-transferase CaiB-like acyl-CoA transferase
MLNGIRVLDLTQYLSGPSCTQLLAGMGADVIKVEPGPGGDPCRQLPVVVDGTSSYYVQQNRGKRSVCLDFNHPAGHELIRELAGRCDVLVENFGHGVMERRGLDYDTLAARHPALIMVSISAFGRTGPLAHLPGYDLIAQAYAGSIFLTGEPDRAPVAASVPIADCGAGALAFGAIGHALFHRTRTGRGQYLDISMVETVFNQHPFAVQGPSVTDGKLRLRRSGRHFGSVPPAGTYQGPEGYVVLQVLEPQWPRLCEAVARTSDLDLAGDTRFGTPAGRSQHRHELVDLLEGWMQTFDSDAALLATLEEHRCPAAPVVDPAEAHTYPLFAERGAVREVHDETVGTVRVPGYPIHSTELDRDRPEPAAPRLGQHSAEVLTELLGYDEHRIAALRRDGVLLGEG